VALAGAPTSSCRPVDGRAAAILQSAPNVMSLWSVRQHLRCRLLRRIDEAPSARCRRAPCWRDEGAKPTIVMLHGDPTGRDANVLKAAVHGALDGKVTIARNSTPPRRAPTAPSPR